MRGLKICLVAIFCVVCLSFAGCKDKSLPQPEIERDIYNTGGNLTFVYDKVSHVATFGGEGEVIQFYKQDIVRGWNEDGNKIGFQILLPKVKEYRSGQANLDGKKMLPNEYVIGEGESLVAQFYLPVWEGKNTYNLKVIWDEGKDEQFYTIKIKEGTLFMTEGDLNK